jgi:hypothetical protein
METLVILDFVILKLQICGSTSRLLGLELDNSWRTTENLPQGRRNRRSDEEAGCSLCCGERLRLMADEEIGVVGDEGDPSLDCTCESKEQCQDRKENRRINSHVCYLK